MDYQQIIKMLTLEEKASLCSGANNWDTKSVPHAGVPYITMSDGPHGVRRQDNYQEEGSKPTTRETVCYPVAAALAASFDRVLLNHVGTLLGEEALANDVQVLLGPGVNIKRSPLCGRNFEYYSEDPFLAGELAASYIQGLQAQGVSACVKHFAANNQEYRRMSTDTIVDERTLREIYLPAFEAAVKQGRTNSVMCSYNQINGVYSCENPWLLTDVLRDEWGFNGVVVTDWGAMNDRRQAIKAGLNIEMPSSRGVTDKHIVDAVKDGTLSEEVLDKRVEEILHWIDWCQAGRKETKISLEDHHAEAREIAGECAVLLKNEDEILPLKKEQKVVFIGEYAEAPRFQGGGSSHINCSKITSALEASADYGVVQYAKMFTDSGRDEDTWDKALELAKNADVAVVFAGLPTTFESEGFDRKHLNLPYYQEEAIEAIAEVQQNLVVVLHNGSPVVLRSLDRIKGLLEMYLAGQAGGAATADILFGKVNPSGKLAETFPLRLEDNPTYPDYAKSKSVARYGEGVYVGYRYYDSRNMQVEFPFGYGLSYTNFKLKNLRISTDKIDDDDSLTVSVDVKNIGVRSGKEVVQLYVGFSGEDHVGRPLRQLKGFEKVEVEPGETKTVLFHLDKRSFAYYETEIGDWYVESGWYKLYIGTSSRDLPLEAKVEFVSKPLPLKIDDRLTVGDILDFTDNKQILESLLPMVSRFTGEFSGLDGLQHRAMFSSMLDGLPLHSIRSFSKVKDEDIENIRQMLRDIQAGDY